MSRFDIIAEGITKTRLVGGEIWECGCFIGDFAAAMLPFIEKRTLRLFDTFEGMPVAGPNDQHQVGSMRAELGRVAQRFQPWEQVIIHVGRMPVTFGGMEDRVISVVNLDVDNEQCARECLPWLYTHVHAGGYLVIDDYNCPACRGLKAAVDEFMRDKPEQLVQLGEGGAAQAHFIKL